MHLTTVGRRIAVDARISYFPGKVVCANRIFGAKICVIETAWS